MPLIPGKSKKAFEKNVKTEMEHGKPQPQALAISYSIKRKSPKKKASGGTVESGSKDMNYADGGETKSWAELEHEKRESAARKESLYPKGGKDYSGGQRKGPEGYPKYQEQAQNERGVHTPVSGVTAFPKAKGTSRAGDLTKDRYAGKPTFEAGPEHPARKEHKRVLEEMRSMPKPKLAEGGEVSASNERRPMPESEYDDARSVSRNSAKAAPRHGDRVLEDVSGPAHNKPKVQPIKHPKMVPQSVYSARLRDEEEHLQSTASPGPYGEQPSREDDEEGPNRQGPPVRDMQKEHSTKRPPYAKGGEVEPSDYEDDLLDLPPSEDEGSMMAHSMNEEGPDRHGPDVPDMEDEHITGRKPYADGGDVDPSTHEDDEKTTEEKRKEVSDSFKSVFAEGGTIQYSDAMHSDKENDSNPATRRQIYADEMDDQPSEEEELARQSSLAAAVMSKMKKYAKGGEITESRDHDDILSHDSIESHPEASQVDLKRNAEEDANEEDQLSFNSLMKENYSESDGLDALDQPTDSNEHGGSEERDSEDQHDKSTVNKILAKMRKRSPIQEGGSGR